jgi:hypothetical protein
MGISQEMKTLLASNFNAKNQVVKLDIHSEYHPLQFKIGIVKNGTVYYNTFYAREGVHYYDLRTLDEWKGTIEYLVTDLSQNFIRKHELVNANIQKEWDVFLGQEAYNPAIVNLVQAKTFYKQPATKLAFFLVIILTIIFFYFKIEMKLAFFSAFLVIVTLIDGRMLINHFRNIDLIESNNLNLNPISFATNFEKEARPILENGSWIFKGGPGSEYIKLYFKYKFADIHCLPHYTEPLPKGTFIISLNKPKENQKTILQKDGIYLHRQE